MLRLYSILGLLGAACAASSSFKTSTKTTAPSTARVTTPPGCSPITVTTSTLTLTSDKYLNSTTVTSTVTDTRYSEIYVTVATETETSTTYKTTRTRTSTTQTLTTVVFAPAKKTVTVPSPSPFTPVRCETAFFVPTVTVTSYLTSAGPPTTYPRVSTTVTETFDGFTYTSTVTVTGSITTSISSVLRIKTVTSQRATRTQFGACASPNIADRHPDGTRIAYVDLLFDPDGFTPETTVDTVEAADATDCCELCQARSGCTGSAFRANLPTDTGPKCTLLGSRNGTCNQSKFYAEKAYGQKYYQGQSSYFVVSNGLCGQYDFVAT